MLAFVLGTFIIKGQIANTVGGGNEVIRSTKYSGISGSPYLFDDWKVGSVIDKEGNRMDNVSIKYDAYRDQIEVLKEGGNVIVLDNDLYPEFSIYGPEILNFKNSVQGIIKIPGGGYFQVLFTDKVSLLKRHKINYVETGVATYGAPALEKRFEQKKYYFLVLNGYVNEITLRKKSVLDAIGNPAEEKELLSYAKNKKLSFTTESDLVKILQFYNEKTRDLTRKSEEETRSVGEQL